MIDDLAPLLDRRLSFGVVPDWHGEWPLAAHRDYCRMLQDGAEELLLHGLVHRRQRGSGPASWLTGGADEMNGLDAEETRRAIARGQRAFADVFGEPATGFLAPAWQQGHVRGLPLSDTGIGYTLGFFSLDAFTGGNLPLATWTWDCGRWGWLGHIGHGIGWLLQSRGAIPVLAIHPRDLDRGFWPRIVTLTRSLMASGFEPATPAALLQRTHAEVAV